MGKMLDALQKLQIVERQIAEVRARLRKDSAAVTAQQARIEELERQQQKLTDEALTRQKYASSAELDLKSREADIAKLRANLNAAKTNKEYATLLTQINTIKADNSKLEEQALKAMNDVEAVKAQVEQVKEKVAAATKRLEELKQSAGAEGARLNGILDGLNQKRKDAAADVPRETLHIFERISEGREGDAMARVEAQGKRPPFEYICGGCYMTLNAEHANALRTRDELRFCDSCGRILYCEEAGSEKE